MQAGILVCDFVLCAGKLNRFQTIVDPNLVFLRRICQMS